MLDETQLEAYRRVLTTRRDELLSENRQRGDDTESVQLDQSRVGRVSRIDALQQHAMHTATGQRREAELRAIAAALQRLEDELFGLCIECGEEIAPARLDVNPANALCIQCAEQLEQRQ